MMLAHVDEHARLLHCLECCLHYRLRLADECDDGSVGSFAGVDIKELNSLDICDDIRDSVNNSFVASLTEVRDTFHNLLLLFHS